MMSVVYKKDNKPVEIAETCILKMLAYFSIFQYPLSKDEIKRYLHPDAGEDYLELALQNLLTDGHIYEIQGLYLLQNDASLVIKRKEGNQQAGKLLPKAMKIGRFLSRFPYVRGVAISGSLSKMVADEKADIDFFIITKTNRLWIARTCMHIFKKLTFLAGKQHFYCMNYYLDEKALQLNDQNIYTAVETITLLPVCGKGIDVFFHANNWVSQWFASYAARLDTKTGEQKRSWTGRMIEWLLNNKAGDRLDDYLMKMTTRRWQKKKRLGARNEGGKEMDLITDKHFARSNPGMFQEKLLVIYNERIKGIKKPVIDTLYDN